MPFIVIDIYNKMKKVNTSFAAGFVSLKIGRLLLKTRLPYRSSKMAGKVHRWLRCWREQRCGLTPTSTCCTVERQLGRRQTKTPAGSEGRNRFQRSALGCIMVRLGRRLEVIWYETYKRNIMAYLTNIIS